LEEFIIGALKRQEIRMAQKATIAFNASNNGLLSSDGLEAIIPVAYLKQLLIDIGFPSDQLWNLRELEGEMLRLSDPDNVYITDFVRVTTPRISGSRSGRTTY
jgi:hypothetical protein